MADVERQVAADLKGLFKVENEQMKSEDDLFGFDDVKPEPADVKREPSEVKREPLPSEVKREPLPSVKAEISEDDIF